jgi:hypothetical protein
MKKMMILGALVCGLAASRAKAETWQVSIPTSGNPEISSVANCTDQGSFKFSGASGQHVVECHVVLQNNTSKSLEAASLKVSYYKASGPYGDVPELTDETFKLNKYPNPELKSGDETEVGTILVFAGKEENMTARVSGVKSEGRE